MLQRLRRFGHADTHRAPRTSRASTIAILLAVALVVSSGYGPVVSAATDGGSGAALSPNYLAVDSFWRINSTGLGVADVGGPWTVTGPTEGYWVEGGVGQIDGAIGANRAAYLTEAQQIDTDLTVDLAVDGPTGGGGAYVSVIGRRVSNGNDYRVQVRYMADRTVITSLMRTVNGTSTVLASAKVAGLTVGPNEPVRVRLQIAGTGTTAVAAKAWRADTNEPAGWSVSATDAAPAVLQQAGHLGVLLYLSRSWEGVPANLRVANLMAQRFSTDAGEPTPPPPPPPSNQAPVASFNSTADLLSASFDATASTDPDGSIVSHQWNFGDGTTGAGATVDHTYAQPGTYRVTLTVTDDDGATASSNADVAAAAPPPPPPTEGKWSALAGTTVGSAQYPVPAGAIVVSPTGNDAAAGTSAAPLRTIGRAVSVAPSGATIVVRAGSYHESVTLPATKRLTVQSWPGEAVWMDGSVPVTNWVSSNGRWRSDGWTTEFDTSPTFTRGAPDYTQAAWAFVNSAYPMAAHPDQIFIDGVAQRQVGSLAEVVAGTFFHDRAADRLWLGSNPAGKQVRVSKLIRALMVRSSGSVVRGIGIQRYAPSVPDMGAVTLETSGITAENLVIADSATTGLYVGGTDITLRNLHLVRSGMLGMNGNRADNLVMERVLSEGNNVERFNPSPAAGGTKIADTDNARVRDSIFRNNYGTGLWLDVSSSNATFTGNEMRNNHRHGISLEISSGVTVANNFITQNGGYGIKVNNTSKVNIWNNTIVGNDRSLNLVQDSRKPDVADPNMTWKLGPVTVRNNVLANQRFGNCLLCVEDYTQTRTAEQIGVTANGNVYNRPNTSTPKWVAVWSKGAGNPSVSTTLAAFKTSTGQEAAGHATDGPALVDANGKVIGTMPPSSTAIALTTAIANAMGVPQSTRHHGALPR